jgi:hypothetical protein
MQNEPRTYRNSPFQIVLVVVLFLVLGIGFLASFNSSDILWMIPMAGILGITFLSVLFSMSAKTTLSDSGISTQTLLGTKSLAWNEISRVSGSGNAIKLHNNFGDVTVTPRVQLPGYDEVVNMIGDKRPDLFNPMEYGEMSKSWLGTILLPVVGVFFIGFGIFLYSQTQDNLSPLIVFIIIGLVFGSMVFTQPRSVSIQGNSILIQYFFNRKTLSADEIASIDLRYTQTRNGKHYFIALTLANKKVVRIAGVGPSLPIVYLVLRNWRRKNAGIGLTNL